MDKFLSDKRMVVFVGALLLAIASWGSGFQAWHDMFTTSAVFGLIGILGSNLISNMASNILKPPPLITETPVPKETILITKTELNPEVKP